MPHFETWKLFLHRHKTQLAIIRDICSWRSPSVRKLSFGYKLRSLHFDGITVVSRLRLYSSVFIHSVIVAFLVEQLVNVKIQFGARMGPLLIIARRQVSVHNSQYEWHEVPIRKCEVSNISCLCSFQQHGGEKMALVRVVWFGSVRLGFVVGNLKVFQVIRLLNLLYLSRLLYRSFGWLEKHD